MQRKPEVLLSGRVHTCSGQLILNCYMLREKSMSLLLKALQLWVYATAAESILHLCTVKPISKARKYSEIISESRMFVYPLISLPKGMHAYLQTLTSKIL